MLSRICGLSFALALPGAALADSDFDKCVDTGAEEALCRCASERLLLEVGADEYTRYERVGVSYRDNLGSGMSEGDAWDAAVKDQATETSGGFANSLQIANQVGKAHRMAMKACAG